MIIDLTRCLFCSYAERLSCGMTSAHCAKPTKNGIVASVTQCLVDWSETASIHSTWVGSLISASKKNPSLCQTKSTSPFTPGTACEGGTACELCRIWFTHSMARSTLAGASADAPCPSQSSQSCRIRMSSAWMKSHCPLPLGTTASLGCPFGVLVCTNGPMRLILDADSWEAVICVTMREPIGAGQNHSNITRQSCNQKDLNRS